MTKIVNLTKISVMDQFEIDSSIRALFGLVFLIRLFRVVV